MSALYFATPYRHQNVFSLYHDRNNKSQSVQRSRSPYFTQITNIKSP